MCFPSLVAGDQTSFALSIPGASSGHRFQSSKTLPGHRLGGRDKFARMYSVPSRPFWAAAALSPPRPSRLLPACNSTMFPGANPAEPSNCPSPRYCRAPGHGSQWHSVARTCIDSDREAQRRRSHAPVEPAQQRRSFSTTNSKRSQAVARSADWPGWRSGI
jgi:hypothetical protein